MIFIGIATLNGCSLFKNSEDYSDQTPIEVVPDAEMITDEGVELNEIEEVSEEAESEFLISYERGYCFGMCPVFKSEIKSDGSATYEGINFVDNMGLHRGSLTKENCDKIIEKLKEINYFQLDSAYDNPAVMDIPSVTTSAALNGETHTVFDRWQAPKEIKSLYQLLDSIYLTVEWTPTLNNE